jgi:hypothetical protein
MEHQEFECPELKSLVIDGRNYYEACRRDARWMDKISSVVTLTISHFKPRPGESFSTYDILLPLTAIHIGALHLTDVVLHPSPEDLEIPDLAFTGLAFEDMHDPRIMDQIMHLLRAPCQIWFTCCTFGGIPDTFRHFGDASIGGSLVFTDIDQDITPLLRVWDAHNLYIKQCPGFDDTTLDTMGSEENGTFAYATYMRTLLIIDSSNFSIAALRRFVESRLHLPPDNGNQWNPIATRVQRLCLYDNVPSISEADRAWFVANVPRFCHYGRKDSR